MFVLSASFAACGVTLVGTDEPPPAPDSGPDAPPPIPSSETSTPDVGANDTGTNDDAMAVADALEDCNRATSAGCPCGLLCASKTCTNGACDPLVFVTKGEWSGTIGSNAAGATGPARASFYCQEAASKFGRSPLTVFRAWMSDLPTAPAGTGFVKSSRPYRLPDGVQVAPSFKSFATGLLVPINRTEENAVLPGARVWTGTMWTGQRYDERCGDWATTVGTGGYGSTDANNEGWSLSGNANCTDALHLYCFEQLP